jgi:hypothetical protein
VNQIPSTSTNIASGILRLPSTKTLSFLRYTYDFTLALFLDTAFLYGVRQPVPVFFLARHSRRLIFWSSPVRLYPQSSDTNSNVRLPPRPLGSQHPGDVKCGLLAFCDNHPNTTTIPLRDTLATLPLPTATNKIFNTGTHMECPANNHLPFCDSIPLRYSQLRISPLR